MTTPTSRTSAWCRVAMLVGAAAAFGVPDAGAPADMTAFAAGGRAIVTGQLATVYAHAGIQAGPVQLVLSWLFMLGSHGAGPTRLAAAVVNAALMIAAIACCRLHARRDDGRNARRNAGSNAGRGDHRAARPAQRELLVGILVLLWLSPGPFWDGHPVEALIPVLWLVAVDRVDAARWTSAGIALALSAAIAPWGVLAFPAVLACRHRRSAGSAIAVGITLGVLGYLPFALTGHFALLTHTWAVSPGSLIHMVAPGRLQVGWGLRLAQAATVAGGTTIAAWAVRRRHATPAIAALVAAVLRVATDPVQFNYYWVTVGVLAIAITATLFGTEQAWWAAAVAYVAWAGATIGWTLEAAGACLVLCLPMIASFDFRGWYERHSTARHRPAPPAIPAG